MDLLLTRAYETYIEELKQYHNPRYGRGPIGGNYYAGVVYLSKRAVWRSDHGDAGRA